MCSVIKVILKIHQITTSYIDLTFRGLSEEEAGNSQSINDQSISLFQAAKPIEKRKTRQDLDVPRQWSYA